MLRIDLYRKSWIASLYWFLLLSIVNHAVKAFYFEIHSIRRFIHHLCSKIFVPSNQYQIEIGCSEGTPSTLFPSLPYRGAHMQFICFSDSITSIRFKYMPPEDLWFYDVFEKMKRTLWILPADFLVIDNAYLCLHDEQDNNLRSVSPHVYWKWRERVAMDLLIRLPSSRYRPRWFPIHWEREKSFCKPQGFS